MDCGLPDDDTVRTAIAAAMRAPSVHNTQPWRWRIGDTSIHLHTDPARVLPVTDPDQRDLLLSCGTALHHLRIAFAALGWSTVIHRLPNPANPTHLAAIGLVPHRPTGADIALSAAIAQRRTDRRRYSSWPVPPGHVALVRERAAAHGTVVRQIGPAIYADIVDAVRTAANRHASDPDYLHELSLWSGRHGSSDGVPARNTPQRNPADDLPSREFVGPALIDRAQSPDAAELLVLGTPSDDRASRLRAGEALSAALLTATNIGLATCVLTEPLEIPHLRARLRSDALDDGIYPQALLRIGWAPTSAAPLPVTPRRPIAEILDPFDKEN